MLTFNLKKEWFEKIKSGERTHEYRIMSEYWNKRITNLFKKAHAIVALNILRRRISDGQITELYPDFEIRFACGYPKKNDKEKFLKAKILLITCNVNGIDTDLKIDKPVYDIEFELIKEQTNEKRR